MQSEQKPVFLLKASYILTSANDPIIVNGSLVWQAGTILSVGDSATLSEQYPDAKIIDCNGQIVLPGLINAHDHGRGIGTLAMGVPDDALEVWLNGLFSMRPVDCYLSALYDGLNLLRSGVTTTVHQHNPRDWSNIEEELRESARGYRDAGIRASIGLPLIDQNLLYYLGDQVFLNSLPAYLAAPLKKMGMAGPKVDWQAVLDISVRLQKAWSTDSFTWYHWAPVGVQWCSDELLLGIKQAAGHSPIQIHLLETRYQQAYGQKAFDSTMVAHLAGLGFLDENVSCAHGVWLTDADIQIIAEHRAMVVHNPSSNLRLRSGVCRVLDLMDASVRVAIGLDGATLSDDQDMFVEMRLAKALALEPGVNERSLSPRQILGMATLNAAEVVAGPGPIRGMLKSGAAADLIALRVDRIVSPYVDDRTDILDVVFRRAKTDDIDTVIVNGEIQMRAGRHLRQEVNAVETALNVSLAFAKSPEQIAQEQMAGDLRPYIKAIYSHW